MLLSVIIWITYLNHLFLVDLIIAILPGEGTGLLCAFAVLKMLSNISLSKHPDNIPGKSMSVQGLCIIDILCTERENRHNRP